MSPVRVKPTPKALVSILKVLTFVLIERGVAIGFRLASDTSGFSLLKLSLVPLQSRLMAGRVKQIKNGKMAAEKH